MPLHDYHRVKRRLAASSSASVMRLQCTIPKLPLDLPQILSSRCVLGISS